MTRAEFDALYAPLVRFREQPRPYVQTAPHRIYGQLHRAEYVGYHPDTWAIWRHAGYFLALVVVLVAAVGLAGGAISVGAQP